MGSLPGAVRINLSTALGHGTGDSLADLLDPTAGTGEASKFLLLDSSGNVTLPGTVGVTGATTLTGGLLTDTTAPVAVETAEHGAGAVGTGVAPATYRYTRDGVIITEIQVDLAGLKCKGSTAKDAIGLTGAAYIGRYVTATCGIVFRIEMICLEVPHAGSGTVTLDIDLGADDEDDIAYDAGVDDIVINTGGIAAGGVYITNTPALTADDYLYLIEGDTAATDGVYDTGQVIVKLYGHPLLS